MRGLTGRKVRWGRTTLANSFKALLTALAVPRGWRVYDAFARNLSGMRAGMKAARCRGALALASSEMHGLSVAGHFPKICASVFLPVFGD